MRTSLLSCLFLPLFFVGAPGQSTTTVVPITPPKAASANTAVTPGDYSAEPFVVEHFDAVYKMSADGTRSNANTVAVRGQSEASLKQLSEMKRPFASGA